MSKQTSKPAYSGRFKIVGATHDADKRVIWCCRYYEPFNVVDTSSDTKRKKMWAECDKYIGKYVICTWGKQSKRGVPLDNVTGHVEDDVV